MTGSRSLLYILRTEYIRSARFIDNSKCTYLMTVFVCVSRSVIPYSYRIPEYELRYIGVQWTDRR